MTLRVLAATVLCAVAAVADTAPAGAQGASSVLVCVAGDQGYVLVRVLSSKAAEYAKNPRNIVPAPGGACPSRAPQNAATTPAPATTTAPKPTPPAQTTTTTTPATTPAPVTPPPVTRAPARRTAATRAKPASGGSGETPAVASAVTLAAPADPPHAVAYAGRALPDTGGHPLVMLLAGLSLLFMGAGARLCAGDERPAARSS